MNKEEQGIYISLMALAWDSDEPGTITLKPKDICREIGIYSATFRRFLRKFPATFRRVGGNLIQPKLELQWVKYKEISSKRSASAVQMHMQKGGSAFASASAIASARSKPTPPTPPPPRGEEVVFEWARETIAVRMGKKKRLPNLEALHGGRAGEVVNFLIRHGFPSRIVSVQ